jgi:hypothetical protein
MSEPLPSVRVTLELDVGSQPIRGTIADPWGGEHECIGWLALIGALEELRAECAERCAEGVRIPPFR